MAIDEVPVLVTDMQAMKEALETAYHKSTAEDILAGYSKLNQRISYSPLTKLLEAAVIKANAYLTAAEKEESDE